MGVVFAAPDPELERAVALKVMRVADDAAGERLLREARAMARLRHPNLITVHEVGSAGDRDFVAMELIAGASLERWLADRPTRDRILDVFAQAARGLQAAHDQGLVHRDFKPHNVLVGVDGRVVVTDFGLARPIEPHPATAAAAPSPTGAADATVSVTGAAGTPAYMAPAQWAGATPDPRSDQFALCVSLWEAIAGARPHGGASHEALRAAAAAGPPRRADGIPAWLLPLLRRGLAPRPADRWPSMASLAEAIARGRRRGRRRWLAATLAVGGLVVAAGVYRVTTGAPRAPAGADDDGVCQPVELAAAELWSPARHARLDAQLAAHPATAARLAATLAGWTTRWREAYQRACADHGDRQRLARVACLDAWRDHTTSYLDALEHLTPEVLTFVPVGDILGDLEPCAAPTPVVPPIAPSPAARAAQRRLGAETIALRLGDRRFDDDAWAALRARVDAVGHPAFAVEVQQSHASSLHAREDYAAAADAYRRVALAADEAGSARVRAMALTGLVEIGIRRRATPEVVDDAMRQARAAVAAAGSPPSLAVMLDLLEGDRQLAAGDADGALARWRAAYPVLVARDDDRRAARIALAIAESLIRRRAQGDLAGARDLLAAEIARQHARLGRGGSYAGPLEEALADLPASAP
jgi:predicted Ser/Thr protein kinase